MQRIEGRPDAMIVLPDLNTGSTLDFSFFHRPQQFEASALLVISQRLICPAFHGTAQAYPCAWRPPAIMNFCQRLYGLEHMSQMDWATLHLSTFALLIVFRAITIRTMDTGSI